MDGSVGIGVRGGDGSDGDRLGGAGGCTSLVVGTGTDTVVSAGRAGAMVTERMTGTEADAGFTGDADHSAAPVSASTGIEAYTSGELSRGECPLVRRGASARPVITPVGASLATA
jgi:hypothetical protein